MVSAQNLAKTGSGVDEIVPQNTNYVKAEGDLNKDGYSDLVIYAQPMLAIYFSTPLGDYVQWKEYNEILPIDEEDDDLMLDITLSITERGALKIEGTCFASAGTSYVSNNNYTYRFQNGDFYKIGEEQRNMSRMTGDDVTISYNYLTHKCQRIKKNAFDETIKPKEIWSSIPKKSLKRLGEELLTF